LGYGVGFSAWVAVGLLCVVRLLGICNLRLGGLGWG